MLSNALVQLRQVRDLGQIISTTFQLLKKHGRPLFVALSLLIIPLVLISGFLFTNSLMGLFSNIPTNEVDALETFSSYGTVAQMGGAYLLFFFAYMLLIALVHEFIRLLHQERTTVITTKQLWSNAIRNIIYYFGISLITAIMIGIMAAIASVVLGMLARSNGFIALLGMMVVMITVLGPFTYFSLAHACHAIERTKIWSSLARSFELVRDNFWKTLALFIVMGMIQAVIIYAIIFVIVMFGFATTFMGGGMDPEQLSGKSKALTLAISALYSLVFAISTLTYPIIHIAMCLKYFSLVEKQEGAGLKEQVAQFEQN